MTDTDGQTIFIAIIVVCVLVFLLCLYKIAMWFRRDDVVRRINAWKQERQAHGLYPLHSAINRIRLGLYCVFCTAAGVAMLLLANRCANNLSKVFVPLGIIALAFIINNSIVNKKWRCPACHSPLPRILGRSSLRPKMVDACPHCGRVWKGN